MTNKNEEAFLMKRQRICALREISPNGMMTFTMDTGTTVLVLNSGNDYYAYQALCPHQEVRLDEGFYDGAVLTCHQHLWQWDVTTGANIGLAEIPLKKYSIKVEGEELFLLDAGEER